MRWRLLTVALIILTALSSLLLAHRDRPAENTDKQSESLTVGTAEMWEPPM
jgi:hypothetical protein